MKLHQLALNLLAIAVLAACQNHDAPPSTASADSAPSPEAELAAAMPQRPPAPTVAHGNVYEVAVGGPETQQALPLPAGGRVTAQVVVPNAGRLLGISVLIGNYFNSSTGPLEVEACVAERCVTGTADAGLSVDNESFDVELAQPLELAANDVLTYSLGRPEGANDLALWTFAAANSSDHLVEDTGRTPKTRLLME